MNEYDLSHDFGEFLSQCFRTYLHAQEKEFLKNPDSVQMGIEHFLCNVIVSLERSFEDEKKILESIKSRCAYFLKARRESVE